MAEHHPIRQMAFVEKFRCLGSECEDTCCKSWNMQLDGRTYARYESEAPELLASVTEDRTGRIMKRDACSDFCVKFEQGLCAIHRDLGSDFLGDACHFYPRVTRRLGNQVLMSAALSCPEITRLALFHEGGFDWRENSVARLPDEMKNYLPEALDEDAVLAVHKAFLDATADEAADPSRIMARIISVAQSLSAIDMASWPMAASFYLQSADARLMTPELSPVDPFNLLHALMGIVAATGSQNRERLLSVIHDMEKALHVQLEWDGLGIRATGDSTQAYAEMEKAWHEQYAPSLNPMLRRWIASQISLALFPFGGFGETLIDRAFLIGVRFATMRLALMCACQVQEKVVDEAHQVRIIQSLSRVLDHLADPALSLQIYAEPGWLREARIRALIGDAV